MYSNSFDGIFTAIFTVGIIATLVVGGIIYGVIRLVRPPKDTYESKTILVPTIKLHTDGKVIDTIYVYKIK